MSSRDYSAVREIKARINLADLARRYMELRQVSGRWKGLCPFHQEKTPSFSINEQDGFFYCFGCHASGDLIDFYCRVNGLEFREAIAQLAEEAGVELQEYKPDPRAQQERDTKRQCLRMYEIARNHFSACLRSPKGKQCRDYIAGRSMAPQIVEAFELGWAPDEWHSLGDALQSEGFSPAQGVESGLLSRNERGNMYDRFRGRLIFPIKDLSGQVIAFGGRIIVKDEAKEQAKYINSSDTPIYKKGEHLYGLFQARRAITAQKRALLTEGYMDVLTLHQFGYENACGVLGTALTPDQVKRLGGFCSSIDLIFDGDEAGRKAALKSCEMILSRGMQCRVVLMPEGEDVDSLLQGQGTEAFEGQLQAAPDGMDYCMSTVSQWAPREVLEWVTRFLDSLVQPELRSFYISRLAGGLGLDEADLRRTAAPKRPVSARYGMENGPGWHPEAGGRTTGGPSYANRQGAKPTRKYQNGKSERQTWSGAQAQPSAGRSGGYANRGGARRQQSVPQPPAVKPSLAVSLEETVLLFLVRYPHLQSVLEEHGGRELLQAPWAERLWEAVLEHGTGDVAMYLDGKEKEFWIRNRVENSVPAEKEQEELRDVCAFLEKNRRQQQGQSLVAAMRQMKQGGEPDADMELLRVLNESLGRSNGEY
ncbi:DNA primase [Desulfovibrio subterraneus]|uniref:DNA primase n=1 Tax=Desulfovibrio subterraneus TaxID=2718620 RepID=UPI0022B8A1CE|nr:DNA primase [Desulfovibrio subterraneus]WBF68114.1 DNA primase [Desulfovibrio subterraneus]